MPQISNPPSSPAPAQRGGRFHFAPETPAAFVLPLEPVHAPAPLAGVVIRAALERLKPEQRARLRVELRFPLVEAVVPAVVALEGHSTTLNGLRGRHFAGKQSHAHKYV